MDGGDEDTPFAQETCARATEGGKSYIDDDDDQASPSASDDDGGGHSDGDSDGDGNVDADSSSRGGTILELLAQRDELQRCVFMTKESNCRSLLVYSALTHHTQYLRLQKNKIMMSKNMRAARVK